MDPLARRVGFPSEDTTGRRLKFINEFDGRLRRHESSFSTWKQWAKKYYDTYGGDPWPDGAKEAMEASDRPAANFNYSLSTINAVVGQDMADRREAQYRGDSDDYETSFRAELYTRLLRNVYKRSKGHRQESIAFHDQLITGYGWCEAFLNVSRFPFRITMKHVDCFEIKVDPDYQDDNCADARYMIRERKWTKEDALAKWPEKSNEIHSLSSTINTNETGQPRQVHANNYGGPSTPDMGPALDEDSIWVYDYQFRRKEAWVVVANPDGGKPLQMAASEFPAWKKERFGTILEDGSVAVPEIQFSRFQKDVFYRAWLAGGPGVASVILEEPKPIAEEMFTYRCVTGFRRKEKVTGRTKHFGLMALIYEPQLWSAKSLSSIIEMLARAGKGGGFIRPGALADPDDFVKTQAVPGKWHLLSEDIDDAKKAVIERDPVVWPQALEQILRISTEGIPYLTAVTDWVKGTATKERSNVLISNLQQQSMVVLNPLFDPLSQFRIDLALLLGRMIQNWMATEEINRILAGVKCEGVTFTKEYDQTGKEVEQPILMDDPEVEGGQRPVEPADIVKNPDVDLFDYDITVDLGPASTTAKQAMWQMTTSTAFVQDLMKSMPQAAAKFIPFLIRNMPGLPAETAKTMASEIESEMEIQQKQGTMEGVAAALQTFDPATLQQVMQMAQQLMAQMMGGQPGQPAQPGAAPPPAAAA